VNNPDRPYGRDCRLRRLCATRKAVVARHSVLNRPCRRARAAPRRCHAPENHGIRPFLRGRPMCARGWMHQSVLGVLTLLNSRSMSANRKLRVQGTGQSRALGASVREMHASCATPFARSASCLESWRLHRDIGAGSSRSRYSRFSASAGSAARIGFVDRGECTTRPRARDVFPSRRGSLPSSRRNCAVYGRAPRSISARAGWASRACRSVRSRRAPLHRRTWPVPANAGGIRMPATAARKERSTFSCGFVAARDRHHEWHSRHPWACAP